MTRLLLIFCLLLCATTAYSITIHDINEPVVIAGKCLSPNGRVYLQPDSVRIEVYDQDGNNLHDAWYNSADAQATDDDSVLVFTDAFSDIGGVTSDSLSLIIATFYVAGDTILQDMTRLYVEYDDRTTDSLMIIKGILSAITDSNLARNLTAANYKATGFAVPGDPMTLQGDTLELAMQRMKATRDSLQYLVTATGFSTFDAGTDSVNARANVTQWGGGGRTRHGCRWRGVFQYLLRRVAPRRARRAAACSRSKWRDRELVESR